jgi:hypothetical protein
VLGEWLEAVQDNTLKDMVLAWVKGGAKATPRSRSEGAWETLSLQEGCDGWLPEAFESDVNAPAAKSVRDCDWGI